MKYYLSYKGKVFGHAITKEEAETKLKFLSGTIEGVEIMEFDDKLIPIKKSRFVNSIGKKKTKKINKFTFYSQSHRQIITTFVRFLYYNAFCQLIKQRNGDCHQWNYSY